MNTNYAKWAKFADNAEDEDALASSSVGIGAQPSMSFEDLDRVVCRTHNVYHNLGEECPKCRSIRMGRPADDKAALCGKADGNANNGKRTAGAGHGEREGEPPPPPSEGEVAAAALKNQGNAALTAADYSRAVTHYLEALAVLERAEEAEAAASAAGVDEPGVIQEDDGSGFDISLPPAEAAAAADAARDLPNASSAGAKPRPSVVALRVALHSNTALAELKRERWGNAAEAATRALELEPANHKARFRRGTALARLGRFSEAATDLNKARRALPQDRAIRKELKQVQEALKAEEEGARNRAGLAHLRKKLEDMPDDSFSMQDAMREVERMAKQLPTSTLKDVLKPEKG